MIKKIKAFVIRIHEYVVNIKMNIRLRFVKR